MAPGPRLTESDSPPDAKDGGRHGADPLRAETDRSLEAIRPVSDSSALDVRWLRKVPWCGPAPVVDRRDLAVLADHLAAYPANSAGLVFTDTRGRALRRRQFGDVWAAARQVAPEGTTFHDLRHFYASLLIQQRESIKTVQARLGHKSAVETLDTYAHLWPDEGTDLPALDEALSGLARASG